MQVSARVWAVTVMASFALSMVANGLVNAGIIGFLTVDEILATHPIYLAPAQHMFWVWILSESGAPSGQTSACES